MTAMYGVLFAVPVIWACAGYVLVSHPGTDAAGVSRANAKLTARPAEWGWPESMALASPGSRNRNRSGHRVEGRGVAQVFVGHRTGQDRKRHVARGQHAGGHRIQAVGEQSHLLGER